MNEEELMKKFDKEQLNLLIERLKDINNYTGFKNGAFKYYLGKYEADILINRINELEEEINKLKGDKK